MIHLVQVRAANGADGAPVEPVEEVKGSPVQPVYEVAVGIKVETSNAET